MSLENLFQNINTSEAEDKKIKIKSEQEVLPATELPKKSLEGLSEIEKNSKEKQEKNLKLVKIRKEVENACDRLGKQIDEGIKETVIMFNANELPTFDSCEGHIERGLPIPFVVVSAQGEPEERFIGEKEVFKKVAQKYNLTSEEVKAFKNEEAYWEAMRGCSQNEETEEYRKWNKKNEKLLTKGHALLKEFYKERQVDSDVKLHIKEGVGDFRIHNGGKDYQFVIEKVRELTEEEKKSRAEKVRKYRAEMQEFTKFLKDKYFSELSVV